MNSGILCTGTMIFLIYNIRGSLLSCLFYLTAPHSASPLSKPGTSPPHPGTPVPDAPGLCKQEAPLLQLVFRLGFLNGAAGCFLLAVFCAWVNCSSPLLCYGVQAFLCPHPLTRPPAQQPQVEDPTTVHVVEAGGVARQCLLGKRIS